MNPRTPLAVASLAIGALILSSQPVGAAVEPPSPATGHAEVVSQGIAEFADGEFHWQVAAAPVTPTPTPLDASAPTFVISTGTSAVVVDGDSGPVARLAPGESLFRRAGDTSALHSLAPSGATALTIAAVAGPGDVAATFTPGASTRDVDLVRDVLNTNEALPLQTDVAALVVVTAGSVDAGGVAIAAGGSAPVTGNVALINTSAEPAVVFVALIGPTLGDVVLTEPTTPPAATQAPAATAAPAPNPPTTAPPASTPPATDGTESTPPTEPPTMTEPAPAPDPTLDSDGDGLRDTDEAGFGSDPFDPDTDNDGLNDGADRGAGCSPTSYDTDGDGFSDGSEINAGTNCAVAGTNG